MSQSNRSERFKTFIAGRPLGPDENLTYWDLSKVVVSITINIIVIWFLIAALISGGLAIWSSYESINKTNRQEKQSAENAKEQAARDIAAKCGLLFQSVHLTRECISSEIATYEKASNTDQDLKAQQDMALWAFWMFLGNIVSIGVSAIGVILLIASLRQTRQAISNDREIGEKQVRAYVSIKMPKDGISTVGVGIPLEANLDKINSGQSPAHDIKYIAGFFIDSNTFGDSNRDFGLPSPESPNRSSVLAVGESGFIEATELKPFTAEDIQAAMENGGKRIYVAAIVFYKDVFGKDRKTRFCAGLTYTGLEQADPNGRVGKLFNWVLTAGHNDAT